MSPAFVCWNQLAEGEPGYIPSSRNPSSRAVSRSKKRHHTWWRPQTRAHIPMARGLKCNQTNLNRNNGTFQPWPGTPAPVLAPTPRFNPVVHPSNGLPQNGRLATVRCLHLQEHCLLRGVYRGRTYQYFFSLVAFFYEPSACARLKQRGRAEAVRVLTAVVVFVHCCVLVFISLHSKNHSLT